jgi:hypothetical protein
MPAKYGTFSINNNSAVQINGNQSDISIQRTSIGTAKLEGLDQISVKIQFTPIVPLNSTAKVNFNSGNAVFINTTYEIPTDGWKLKNAEAVLREDNELKYNLILNHDKSKLPKEAILVLSVKYDPELIDLKFTQGKFKSGKWSLDLAKYEKFDNENKSDGILLILSAKKTKTSFKSEILLVQDFLSPGLAIDKVGLNETFTYVAPPPPGLLKKLAPIILALLLTALVIFLFIRSKKKFQDGIISIVQPDPQTITLKGKTKYEYRYGGKLIFTVIRQEREKLLQFDRNVFSAGTEESILINNSKLPVNTPVTITQNDNNNVIVEFNLYK